MWTLIQNGSPSLITDIKIAINSDVSNQERKEFEGKWKESNFNEFFPEINLDDEEVEREFSVTVVDGSLENLSNTPTPNPYVTPTTVTYNPNLPGPPNVP